MELDAMFLVLLLILAPCAFVYLIVKSKRRKITFSVITLLLIGLFLLCHATPENSVKSKAFFHGYPIKSLSNPLSKAYTTTNEEIFYVFKDELSGLGYATKKGFLGLWYVDKNLIVD